MSKDSFLIYKDSLDVLDELTKEQVADLFFAIRDYQNGKQPNLDGLMKAIFIPFKNQFDRDSKKYEEVVERRRKAGALGGKAKASKDKQMLANASKDKQSLANLADNVPVPVPESDSVIKEKEHSNECSKKKSSIDLSFCENSFLKEPFLEWLDYKREIKDSYKTQRTVEACFRNLQELSGGVLEIAEKIVRQSIANGYKGLFPIKEKIKKPACDYEALLNLDLE